ncbi:MAG: hypothetical protein LC117_04065 [Bacteroidia bacterium]|nr:hypothetical protein [Bacteroidia bacterium]MCZ2277084.1 hypothetical protein [Bacteroidia bacterium]
MQLNKLLLFLLIDFLPFSSGNCQGIEKIVTLDSVVVSAVSSGFSVTDFIEMMKEDTSFHEAFTNLHRFQYTINSYTEIKNRKGEVTASRQKNAVQRINGDERQMQDNSETVDGKFYNRKGQPAYLTIEMLDNVFFPEGVYKVSPPTVYPLREKEAETKLEKYRQQIKTLIFQPGRPIKGLPVIGNKASIFDESLSESYDYSLAVEKYHDSIPCYVFRCVLKQDIHKHSDAGFITYLESWFDRKTFSIIARNYSLKYKSLLIDMDIKMEIETGELETGRLPVLINYSGMWNVPFKKNERISFVISVQEI